MIPIDDVLQQSQRGMRGSLTGLETYVVPVSATWLEGRATEAEGTLPFAGLGGILGQWKLPGIVVP